MTETAYRETTTAIAIAGSADAGKSTFIGVITSGRLDNGNGSARQLVSKHQHEITRGISSDISTKILDIPEKNKALTLIDLCGQADYLKTTTFGLTGYYADYCVIVVSANNSVQPMTIQHMRIITSLSIPILIVVTRPDITPKDKYIETMKDIRKKLIIGICEDSSKTEFVNNYFDETYASKTNKEQKVIENNIKEKIITRMTYDGNKQFYFPVITISNTTGYFINVIKEIMETLPIRGLWNTADENHISKNKVVSYIKQNVIQRISENFMKILMFSIFEFIDLKNIIKNVALQMLSKMKQNVHNSNNGDKSFITTLISKITEPLLAFGKLSDDKVIQQLTSEYAVKHNLILFQQQNNFIEKSVKNIITNLNLNLNLDLDLTNEINNMILEAIMDKLLSQPNSKTDIMISTCNHIINKLKQKNQLDKLISQFDSLFSNKELYENIKKHDAKQFDKISQIRDILEKTYYFDALKEKEINDLIFQPYQKMEGSIFYIDNCYNPPGIGLVITGINRGIDITTGEKMFIGPVNNDFIEFKVKSMHNNNREIVDKLCDHGRGTIAIAIPKKGDLKRSQVRKGMISMSSLTSMKYICFRFKAVITIFAESVTIKTGYTPVIHLGTIKQSARMVIDPNENEGLEAIGFDPKNNNIAIVTFKFVCSPEFVEPYSVFLFRSGNIHGYGVVLNVFPVDQDPDAKPDERSRFKSTKHS